MALHPRLSVSGICSLQQSFEEDLALWADLGIAHVGLTSPKLHAAGWDAQRVLDAGLEVSSLSAYREEPVDWDFMRAVGCGALYTVAGSAHGATWEDAADRFCEEMAPVVAQAEAAGVQLAVEPTNPLRSDASFVHTVRDAVHLARRSDIGVVLDLYSAWYERGLEQLLRENIDIVTLVQIDDFEIGTADMPNRSVIGDGDIPIERVLGVVLDAGYEGPIELEILGPRIEAEGYRSAIGRSVERSTAILDRLGA